MKKFLLSSIVLSLLIGCSTSKQGPKEFYKISDADVVSYLTEVNNIEKCLPKGIRLKSLNDAERRVLNGTQLDALSNIVGPNNAEKIWYSSSWYGGDENANAYFEQKQIELAHKKSNVTASECSVMKERFSERLQNYIARENYKNSPAGQAARIAQQQADMQTLQMIHGMGAQIQRPAQLDYWQQLEIEKAKARAKRKPVQTQTNCYNIGNQIYCDSTSY